MFQGWLELTIFGGAEKACVKCDAINCFYADPMGYTVVGVSERTKLNVQESVEKIVEMLELKRQ